jgi:hypothetical protein
MAAGGRRIGSGRPKGAASKANEEARAKALASGVSPLDYMLGVMRDSSVDDARRDDMAKAAAPYLHSKMAQGVEFGGNEGGPIIINISETDSML